MPRLNNRWLALVLALLPTLWFTAAHATNAMAEPREFNIPAKPMPAALRAFASQAHVQLLFDYAAVRDLSAPAVKGRMAPADVLAALLKGSGLTFQQVNARTIAIRGRANAAHEAPHASGVTPSSRGNATRAAMASGIDFPRSVRQSTSSAPGFGQVKGTPALEEVVVTAQKYQQRAIDVPISLTVVGGPQLQQLKITNLEDLQFYVPGLQVDDDGNELVITIRGVSNLGGIQAIVGEYLDDADLTSNSSFGLDLNTYDLARVEVLKGPQGTLYGDGSLGGTIRYVPNRPALGQVQLGADVTEFFDQYGAPEIRVEAVLNAPVVPDVLGIRVAAELDNGGGWVDQPAAGLKNINGKNLADVRLEGRWEPSPDFILDATEVIHRNTFGRYTGEDPAGGFTQVFNLTTTPQLKDNYNISNINIHWNTGYINVVNSSTYWTHYNAYTNFGTIYQFTPPPSPAVESYQTFGVTTQESLSDELRVSGKEQGRWRWTFGGLYKRIDFDSLPALYYEGIPGPPGAPLPTPYSAFADINSNSGSAFGDANYRVLDALVIGAGVRYFRDEENALLLGDAARERGTFTSTDPRFYARYGVSRNVNVYASAAKGFRSGGFNGLGYPAYQPEHAWTYDVGTKMRLLSGHLSLDSDAFLSDYNGYQIVGVSPGVTYAITHNAGDARVKGIETDVAWIPAKDWRLSVNGDYVNARFMHINVVNSTYDVGDPLDYTPRYQVTASAERDFLWLRRAAFTRIDYSQRAPTSYRNRGFGPWYFSQSDYLYLLGWHAGIDWTSNLRLGLFVQNVLNDRGYTGPDVIELNSPRQQPRTFGVDFAATLE